MLQWRRLGRANGLFKINRVADRLIQVGWFVRVTFCSRRASTAYRVPGTRSDRRECGRKRKEPEFENEDSVYENPSGEEE
jgi:hypothetical protein